jgi:hypothetical protein
MGASSELLTQNFSFWGSLGAEMRGRQAFCECLRMVRTALRDYRCDILECVVQDEHAFAKMKIAARGTPKEKCCHCGAVDLDGFPIKSRSRVEGSVVVGS